MKNAQFESYTRNRMGPVDRSFLLDIIGPAGGAQGLRTRCSAALTNHKTPSLVRKVLPCYMLDATTSRDIRVDDGLAARLRTAEAIPDADFGGA